MLNGFRHEKRTKSDRLCTIDSCSISGRIGSDEYLEQQSNGMEANACPYFGNSRYRLSAGCGG